jgi:hypothetical protein
VLFRSSLVFWNNAQIEVNKNLVNKNETEGFVKLKQGYFLFFTEKLANKTAMALCLIKPTYNLQNNYLQNNFSEWLSLPKEIDLIEGKTPIHAVTLNNKILFSLGGNDVKYNSKLLSNACTLIYFFGISLLFLGVLLFYSKNKNFKNALIVMLIPLAFKVLLWLKLPAFLVNTFLFDVQLFGNAQSLLNPFMADVLFNSIILVYISVFIFLTEITTVAKIWQITYKCFLFVFITLITVQINHCIKSLVSNSNL